MTPEERRQYAATLILEHANEVEYLTIHEMAEEHLDSGEISDEDAKAVDDLICQAKVTITFPDCDLEWS